MANLKVFAIGAGVALALFGFVQTSNAALQPGCSVGAISAARALALETIALSKTDPDAALKIAQDVAKTAPACQQVAYGAVLDGTGTASIGGGVAPSGSSNTPAIGGGGGFGVIAGSPG
jgi:hypothetical protein